MVTVSGDQHIVFFLSPLQQTLSQVNIQSTAEPHKEVSTLDVAVLQGSALEQTRGLSLGDALKSVTGVTTFQTGPSIAKPVIHGLTGSRVLILNNGVALEAQQWGQEHAPDIDPFIANQIQVIKGADGIRYGADAIAGVISVSPKLLPTDTGIMDGEVNAVGMTNSRLGAFSAMLEGALGKKLPGLSYRVQGTFKRSGDVSTPNYLLGNTGLLESDFSAAIQYYHKNYGIEGYYSNFYTKIGIEFGTDVGSLSDILSCVFRRPSRLLLIPSAISSTGPIKRSITPPLSLEVFIILVTAVSWRFNMPTRSIRARSMKSYPYRPALRQPYTCRSIRQRWI